MKNLVLSLTALSAFISYLVLCEPPNNQEFVSDLQATIGQLASELPSPERRDAAPLANARFVGAPICAIDIVDEASLECMGDCCSHWAASVFAAGCDRTN